MKERSTPCVFGILIVNTKVTGVLTSYCLLSRKSDVDVQFLSTFQKNYAEGSKICIRFLFSCLPLSREFFCRCRLCNSPRFYNSPQIPHHFSVIIHNTIECNTLNSSLVHRNAEFRVDAERSCAVQRHTSRPKTTNAPSLGKDAHNDQKLIYEVCHHAGS